MEMFGHCGLDLAIQNNLTSKADIENNVFLLIRKCHIQFIFNNNAVWCLVNFASQTSNIKETA